MRCTIRLASLVMWLLLGLTVTPGSSADATLHFDDEMATVIWARQWDDTQAEWLIEGEREKALFFDAVHRFLLIRFPGCAEVITNKVSAGYEITSANLILTWQDQEWLRTAYGYHHRGYRLKEMEPETWHARVWLLRRPWTVDAEIGPTWNAHISGAGFWAAGGARDTERDRWPDPLGQVLLGKDTPTGSVDVTAALSQIGDGRSLGQRLRDLESCGFLIDKAELASPAAGSWGLSTGNCRVFVTDPMLNELMRYHLRTHFEARWLRPFREDDLRVRAGYLNGISTLNLMTQFRSEVALVDELLDRPDMTVRRESDDASVVPALLPRRRRRHQGSSAIGPLSAGDRDQGPAHCRAERRAVDRTVQNRDGGRRDLVPHTDCGGVESVVWLIHKHCSRKKCQEPFAGNRPYGCSAQTVPDTYFSPNLVERQHERIMKTCRVRVRNVGCVKRTICSDCGAFHAPYGSFRASPQTMTLWSGRDDTCGAFPADNMMVRQ